MCWHTRGSLCSWQFSQSAAMPFEETDRATSWFRLVVHSSQALHLPSLLSGQKIAEAKTTTKQATSPAAVLSREQSVVPSVGLTTTAWRQEVMRESVQDPAASTLASVASSAVAVRLDGTGSLTLSHHHNNRRVCEMQMVATG